MAICAVIDSDNVLINLIVAEPTDLPPDGCQLVEIPNGYYWTGSELALIPVGMDNDN